MKHSIAIGLLALGLTFAVQARAQDGTHTSREQASLVEEQELLARKLARLRDSMERLVERFDAEGRVHAAKLLRDGLSHIAAGETGSADTNVELLMTGSHEELRSGQSMQSIQTQEKVIADLERLLSILMDRPDLDQLETSLEELKKLGAELSGLRDAEQELEQATQELREQSSNDAQRKLEEGLQRSLSEQRQLLRENEDGARRSGALDLEKLEAALSELLQDQQTDAAVLEGWMPEAVEPTQAPLEDLAKARRHGGRSERLAADAEALREAAREAETRPEDDDLGQLVRELQARAEREARDARAAGDESARRAAESLQRAAERLRTAGLDAEARQEASREVGELAAELERRADEEARQAAEARSAAREAIREVEADESNPANEAAREAGAQLDRAGEDPETAAEATRRADQLMQAAAQELKFLGQALSASQAQNAERAEQIREGLERLPQETGQSGQEASEALERAGEAMRSASQAASEENPSAAREAAERAREELERALGQLADVAETSSEEQAATDELAARQEQLAQDVRELQQQAQEGSMSPEAQAQVQEAMQEAAEAMEQAAQEMSQGQRGAAAQSQRQASEALDRAAQEAQEGVTPQTEEDQARAEDLAAEQERIEKELFEFMQRYSEREDAPPLPSMSGAQESAQEAQQSLEQGDLSGAQEAEQETQRQIEEALAELEKEEEQYQQLRDEELLFQIAEEVASVLEQHLAISEATLEVDAERKPDSRASRGQKLRLRKVSREEAALANRSRELRTAIEQEGSLVFAELLDRIERDLTRISRETGETGGYKSGQRVQALQSDVTTHATWLLEALHEEMDRREEEQQEPPEGEQPPGQPPEGENRLVPDVAEVRLLARMEVEVIDTIEELLVLYPELSEADDIDPLLLEDIQRMAVRHERATELFKLFRERLGLPAPGLDPSHFGTPEGETDEAAGSEE